MTGRTQVVAGPFRSRRKARALEREMQLLLVRRDAVAGITVVNTLLTVYRGKSYRLPIWARGVRVERAGWTQWVLVATEKRGH